MSANLHIYDAVRKVPSEAQKEIRGGRLKGMTDINPMWRIKILTEQFGPCGSGWTYEPVGREFREGSDGQVAVFVDILLRYWTGEKWSQPIPGTGGSMFVVSETKGLFTSDECVKMATTDAISVAAKALGVGADVYFEKDKTKYTEDHNMEESTPPEVPTYEAAPDDPGNYVVNAEGKDWDGYTIRQIDLAERGRELLLKMCNSSPPVGSHAHEIQQTVVRYLEKQTGAQTGDDLPF